VNKIFTVLFDVIPTEFANIALGQSSTSHFEEKELIE
jgi:hypothetical protein